MIFDHFEKQARIKMKSAIFAFLAVTFAVYALAGKTFVLYYINILLLMISANITKIFLIWGNRNWKIYVWTLYTDILTVHLKVSK